MLLGEQGCAARLPGALRWRSGGQALVPHKLINLVAEKWGRSPPVLLPCRAQPQRTWGPRCLHIPGCRPAGTILSSAHGELYLQGEPCLSLSARRSGAGCDDRDTSCPKLSKLAGLTKPLRQLRVPAGSPGAFTGNR